MTESCRTCRYWANDPGKDTPDGMKRMCKRYPANPQSACKPDGREWCGEWSGGKAPIERAKPAGEAPADRKWWQKNPFRPQKMEFGKDG